LSNCGRPYRRVAPAIARAFAPLLLLAAAVALFTGPTAQAATPCADLVVDSVASTPATPVQLQPSTITVTVRNAGTCTATGFGVVFRPDLFSPAAAPPAVVASLGAGASTTVNIPVTFSHSGLFISLATVDPTNTVAETNEGNNTTTKTFLVATGVDLAVSSVTTTPVKPVAGQSAAVSVTVANLGVNPAGPFRVDWSPNFGQPAIQRQVAGLGAGATTTLSIPYTYAAGGTFASIATADAGGAVSETNEFNNTNTTLITVVPPLADLVVTNVSTNPNPAFAGSLVNTAVTVKNNGVAAAGGFTVQWVPWLLGAPVSAQISSLAAGASTTVSFDSLFSLTGQYAGTVLVDPTNAVAEIDESNNTSPTQVNVVPPTLNAQKIATGGFGDSQNSYSWSMAWFKGKLYVGTARSVHCVEAATSDFYFPGQGYYKGFLDGLPQANCPDDRYALDLRAEIWQYTPESNTWKRVFQSPADVPNPRELGKFVARDIGFRGMVVHNDALYVGGVTADEYIPELAVTNPPRILRSADGETFTPLPTSPGLIHNTFGDQRPIGFRAMTSFNGHLLVTASGGLTGDGVIFDVQDPAGANPQWVQITPNTMQVYEMEPFNNTLYIGNGIASTGYSVWKLTDSTTAPWTFAQVVPNGGGLGSQVTSVVSMQVFRGRLYVGANGWSAAANSQPTAEEIRINPDDSWDVVAGNARTLPDGTTKTPISGLGPGFGNLFNAHMWRAEVHNGALYIGTNDASSAFADVPGLGPALAPEYGFDIWGTCDGRYWWEVTRDAFGDGRWNFGARTLVSSPFGLFIGSTNHVEGTSVWKGDASPCGSGGTTNGAFQRVDAPSAPGDPAAASKPVPTVRAALPAPTRLIADLQQCGATLTWDRVPGATGYRILRSDYRAVEARLNWSHVLESLSPDLLQSSLRVGAKPAERRIWVAGQYRSIATTTGLSFVDRTAAPDGRYTYEIVALGASRGASNASNVASASSTTPKATFRDLDVALERLSGDAGGDPELVRLAHTARASWQQGRPESSLQQLARLRHALESMGARTSDAAATAAIADVQSAIFGLERRASVATACRR